MLRIATAIDVGNSEGCHADDMASPELFHPRGHSDGNALDVNGAMPAQRVTHRSSWPKPITETIASDKNTALSMLWCHWAGPHVVYHVNGKDFSIHELKVA